jgi:predicted TIM-barrel fold metal-dependent hydrolase
VAGPRGAAAEEAAEYYARFDLPRLAGRCVFGTDWPGVPGAARNAEALRALDLPAGVLADVLSGNAAKLFPGLAV